MKDNQNSENVTKMHDIQCLTDLINPSNIDKNDIKKLDSMDLMTQSSKPFKEETQLLALNQPHNSEKYMEKNSFENEQNDDKKEEFENLKTPFEDMFVNNRGDKEDNKENHVTIRPTDHLHIKKKLSSSKTLKELKRFAIKNKCYIYALTDLANLKSLCDKENLIADFSAFDEINKGKDKKKNDHYEVEDILDRDKDKYGKYRYLIKWKFWHDSYNSWEPQEHLTGCTELLKEFNYIYRSIKSEDSFHKAILLRYVLRKILSPHYNDSAPILKLLNMPLNQFRANESHMKILKRNLKKICSPLLEYFEKKNSSTFSVIAYNLYIKLNIKKNFGSVDDFYQFILKREEITLQLHKWSKEISRKEAQEFHKGAIFVENLVDLEGPPKGFTYMAKCVLHPTINEILDKEPRLWCDCKNDCTDDKDNCCPAINEAFSAYNKHGTLIIPPKNPIYECNKKCSCSHKCCNRVIQQGRMYALSIFRTDNGCGWGVKALERIPKGKFVLEYAGEIITCTEADKREQAYSLEGKTYLFNLDFNVESHCQYVIDASLVGNIGHFVNHSCQPNLEVYAAWIDNCDPYMPRIAFFSKRDIKKGEEITFDYKMAGPARSDLPSEDETFDNAHKIEFVKKINLLIKSDEENYMNEKNDTNKQKKKKLQKRIPIKCKCGAQKCRIFLY